MLKKPKKSKPPFFLLLTMLALLLFLLLFLLPSPTSPSPSPLQQACHSTLYPSLCLSQPLNSQTPPLSLILSSLSIPLSSLLPQTLTLTLALLNSSLSSPARATAARNCVSHLTLSSYRLSNISSDDASSLSPRQISRSRAFASAGLLYQYDCWSALKYVNTTRQVADLMSAVDNLAKLTSNALAMITAFQRFGGDLSLWSPPQTERDGHYWPPPPYDDDNNSNSFLIFPSDLVDDVTVCKSGECDYQTVQAAVNAAPDYGANHFVMRIRAGTYEEIVQVPYEKTNVVFIGEGMGRTVITGKMNAKMPGLSTYNTATVGVAGDGFMARELTIENAAGAGVHQAVAFRSDSDRSFLYMVEFLGHQDTLYARSMRQFYRECRISGTVDFVFGNSAAVFEGCLILVVPRLEGPEKGESNALTAHGRTDPGQATGFVFRNCTVNGSEEYVEIYRRRPGRHKVYLGRPWKEYSRTVFLNCYLEEVVRPEGWMPWKGEFALSTLFYGEFGSLGPGANESGRVEWSSQISEERLGVYSVKNFIQSDEWGN